MAKIRVHELAKKLNMTNKALLTKLKAMNIEVKSHMSSLEDETVNQIKLNLFGNKQKEQDSRIGTSVIRRRKKNKSEISSENPGNSQVDQSISARDHKNIDKVTSHVTTEDEVKISVQSTPTLLSSKSSSASETPRKNIDRTSSKEYPPNLSSRSELPEPDISFVATEHKKTLDETDKTPIQPKEPVKEQELFQQDSLLTPQNIKTEPIVDSPAEMSIFEHDSKSDNGKSKAENSYSNIHATSQETGRSGMTDKNKKTEDFNIKEADMPKDLEQPKKSEEQITHQTNSDGILSTTEKVIEPQQKLDDGGPNDTDAVSSDLSQSKDESVANDRKKKRKKKQKKSEPAKIIKLAVPPAPVIPPPSQKRELVEKNLSSDREKANYDKEKTVINTDGVATAKERAPFVKERNVLPDRDKSSQHPQSRSGAKIEPPFTKVRSKKSISPDIPFIPVEPVEKDDAKSKRSKSKVKKKKWGEDEDVVDDTKAGQKKRKSVVEGKDLYEQGFSGRKGRKKDGKNKQRPKIQKTQITVPKAIKRRIKIDETIDLSELAKRMSIKANEMIQKLMGMGIMVTVNQTIDFDTAALVAAEFDYEVEKAAVAEDMLMHAHEVDDPDLLIPRSPVVTIMGHVDHGKTSLLDVIRKSKITTGEAGGITQHIGAYSVQTPNGGIVTFLDTPGHAAFTSMRSRGAQITDLVVLVVAADDGVMPQTIEAINHSKAAGVPVVVAVNKMDKPDADPERVMRELSDHGLLSEEWGGDVIFAKVSAKAGTGIDELLEMILLQAEVLELKANPDRLATGHVVEARLDAGRGPVATVLVQQGTLKTGEPVVCGLHSGKIRLMTDDMGTTIDAAGPSTPVEIVGLSGVPEAGDEFIALASEKDAKQISESRMQKERAKELAKKSRANLEKLFANMGSDQVKQLKLIIKADVHGSLEALNESLMKLAQEEVDIKIVHSGTGAINESDVSLAAVSDAIIIGFNVRPTPKVRDMAKDENVDMRFYDIIYNVINDIKTALTGLMPSTFHEIIIGRAEVRDMFVIPGKGTIAGCFVQDGKVARGERIRLLRDGVIKCDSTLSSLRRFKDDAKEVTQGYECGIGIEKFNDIKMGDIIECYEIEERKASLESIKE